MDDDKELLVKEFCSITGVDDTRARFFLETTAWNLELALSTFFEDPVPMDDDDDLEPLDSPPSSHSIKAVPETMQNVSSKNTKPTSRIRTLGEMENADSSSDEEGQAFFAGGSENSGQQIIGPKKKAKGTNIVADLFKNAKEHGAEVINKTDKGKALNSQPIFQGRAYKLGDPGNVSTPIDSSEINEDNEVEVALKFWQNGFSIDDGPLREFNDPSNSEILDDIRKGQLPKELLQQYRNKIVNVNLEDHSSQDYVKPKKTTISFAGTGHRLGNPTDPITKVKSTNIVNSVQNEDELVASAHSALNFDNSQPIISFQVRLLDGSRINIKLNEKHTIASIRTYINILRPEYMDKNYIFMMTFPTKQLTDESIDLKTAQLNNNQIVTKLQ